MKIRQSIENAKKKNKSTIRQDVVKRAIERGEFERIECSYRYTDDYVYDMVNDYGAGQVSKETMLREYSILRPSCWLSGVKTVNGKECYRIVVNFHSNLSYDMFVPTA